MWTTASSGRWQYGSQGGIKVAKKEDSQPRLLQAKVTYACRELIAIETRKKNVWHMFYVIWIFKEKKKKPRPQSTKVPDSKNYKNKVNEWLTKSADPSETQKGTPIEKQQSFADPPSSSRRKSPLPEKSIIKKPGPLQVKGWTLFIFEFGKTLQKKVRLSQIESLCIKHV